MTQIACDPNIVRQPKPLGLSRALRQNLMQIISMLMSLLNEKQHLWKQGTAQRQ